VEIVAGDAKERHSGRPCAAVALRDQLAVHPQPQPRKVGVRQKSFDTTSRVVTHLEHCVNVVVPQIEVPPRLEPRRRRQRLGGDIDRIAAMVVEHDQFRRAAGEQPLAGREHVRLEPRLPRLPVFGQTTPDLAHAQELRRPLHIDANGDDHSPTLSG
jgi:hypothetical protein